MGVSTSRNPRSVRNCRTLLMICAVVAGFVGINYFKNRQIRFNEQAWGALAVAQTPEALAAVADDYPGTPVALQAWLSAADMLLQQAVFGQTNPEKPDQPPVPLAPEKVRENLERAAKLYQLVIDGEFASALKRLARGFEVTDESTSDSRAFPSLLKQAASKAQIEEVLGDGGYDARSCFNGCAKLGAKPLFRVRKNASTRARGSPSRAEVVRRVRKHGLRVWKRMVGFGRRWAVETAIGSFKAMFGESVMARTVEAAQLEVGLKVAVYNRLC